MIYLQLFWEFLKIGLFAVGGGMATLPFLQDLAESTGWYSQSLITDMIAISESTPGPIGINMATYVGCNVAGFFGGVVATMGEILPSIVIVVLISKSLDRFRGSKLVDSAFYGLRPPSPASLPPPASAWCRSPCSIWTFTSRPARCWISLISRS